MIRNMTPEQFDSEMHRIKQELANDPIRMRTEQLCCIGILLKDLGYEKGFVALDVSKIPDKW